MANNEERASLEGLESAIFDLVGTGAATEQWIEWLNVPLQHAAAAGDINLVTKLQRAGANLNVLRAALKCGRESLACDLLKRGASVIWKDENGDRPLHLAAALGDEETVSLLLEKGARVEGLGNNGRSPLHMAAKNGNLAATKALLAAGAGVNATDDMGMTALHLALDDGNEDVSLFLVQAGADVNATDNDGTPVLHYAAMGRYFEDPGTVVRVLIEAGATVDAQDGDGETPLHYCLFQTETMTVFLECGANPNARDESENSLLHLAACNNSREAAENAVDLLLRWGADETAVNDDDQTPLEVAEETHGVDDLGRLRDLLTQAPVDRNWRRRGWLVLYRAYPIRMRSIPGTGAAPNDRAKKCRARLISTEAAGGASAVLGGTEGAVAAGGGGVPGDWSGAVTWVLGMKLEGVFRNVVKYL